MSRHLQVAGEKNAKKRVVHEVKDTQHACRHYCLVLDETERHERLLGNQGVPYKE